MVEPHGTAPILDSTCSQFATGLGPDLQGTKLVLLCGRVGGTKGR
jgi:hypothetical protein